MDIKLIWPAQLERQTALYPPLGLAYIDAVLYEAGYKPEVIDLIFDLKLEKINKIKENGNVYAFSSVSAQFDFAEKIAGMVKERDPSGTIIFGGPHPTILPEQVLGSSNIDIAVIGEGEYATLEIVRALEENKPLEKIRGIAYKENGKIIKTEPRPLIEDLDKIPFPRQQDFPVEKYFKLKGYRELSLMSTRGCPGNCSFCQPTLRKLFGPKLRTRSVANVVDEIEWLVKRFKLDIYSFSDDAFAAKKDYVDGICREIVKRKIPAIWRCQARVDIDKETLQLMKKSGCFLAAFGIESGSQKILNNIRKGVKVEQQEKVAGICKEIGFLMHWFLMVGTPGETPETINETKRLIKKFKPFNADVAITTPYPCTDMYNMAKEQGMLYDEDFSTSSILGLKGIKLDTMTKEGVLTAKKLLEETSKRNSERAKDIYGLLFKKPAFIENLAFVVAKNPGFVYRMFRLSFRALKSRGFKLSNPKLKADV